MQTSKEQFARMCALYEEWNAKINVISRKDIENVYEHHILHSLAIAQYLEERLPDEYALWMKGGVKVLDLGTGGGFPGIPLASVFPEVEFVLCDSIGKKITVARSVAEALGLKNVRTVNARAESLTESFDWVVSRAVTSLENFYPWVKGKFSKGILYLKGGDVNEEIYALMEKNKVKVSTWKVNNWLNDEYFDEKFVIQIEK